MPKEEILRFKAPSYPVRDGVVKVGDLVWFRGEHGAEQFTLREDMGHFTNLKKYPQLYQISEPKMMAVTYKD